ncbi:RICIN domain-containing protein [Paenibacillus alba]|nr:RICIN domain-containing protein [Paenibacillus alba]
MNRQSGKALELPGSNTAAGSQIDQWTYNDINNHQLFKLTVVAP